MSKRLDTAAPQGGCYFVSRRRYSGDDFLRSVGYRRTRALELQRCDAASACTWNWIASRDSMADNSNNRHVVRASTNGRATAGQSQLVKLALSFFGSHACRPGTARLLLLFRRTGYRAVAAEHAAVSRFRSEKCFAVRTRVEVQTCVGWHGFLFLKAACGTRNLAFECKHHSLIPFDGAE